LTVILLPVGFYYYAQIAEEKPAPAALKTENPKGGFLAIINIEPYGKS